MRIINSIILFVLHSVQYIVKGVKSTASALVYVAMWSCIFVYKGFNGLYRVFAYIGSIFGGGLGKVSDKVVGYQKKMEERQRQEEERKKRRIEEAKKKEERARQADAARQEALKMIRERNTKKWLRTLKVVKLKVGKIAY